MKKIPIEISARHAHLSQADIEKLFGANYSLNLLKEISQPGQFLAKERIDLTGPKNTIKNVAIVGPAREQTQVEISKTDAYFLGIPNTPIAVSGNLSQSGGGLVLIGANEKIILESGIIIPSRHLHISPNEANALNVKDGDTISIKTEGIRSVILNNVAVRINPDFNLSLHLDTDEGNASGVKNGDYGTVINSEFETK